MYLVAILVILSLLFKDVFADRLWLRALSQGVALVSILWAVVISRKPLSWKRYRLVFAYLTVVFLTGFFSDHAGHALLQALSLSVVVIFFIAFLEMETKKQERIGALCQVLLIVGGGLCAASLLLTKLAPGLVYFSKPFVPLRFKGLLAQAPEMGTFAGIVLGIALFGSSNKLPRLVTALAAIFCIYLTFVRACWLGLVLSAAVVTWWLSRRSTGLKSLVAGFLATAVALSALIAGDQLSDVSPTALRPGNAETLAGRTFLWKEAYQKFLNRPLKGYGFTIGEDALKTSTVQLSLSSTKTIEDKQKISLHNGYLQALVDTGLIGLLLYLAILLKAWFSAWSQRTPQHAVTLYVLSFLMVTNLAESTIFAASNVNSVIGWLFVLIGLSYGESGPEPRTEGGYR